jgi:4-amino-4-deoxy-L-arabinose transferase-like glycosyltransferase
MDAILKFRRSLPLLIILLAAFLLRLPRLGHAGVSFFDESFHALVAKNLLKHPLKPTLIDDPKVPYDPGCWTENHVWLHKPILPLWQIALAYRVLGINNLALRLPSLLLSTGAVLLTYLIGASLFDRRTGLIAAALQALNPAITLLVQGYLFADHIDVSLLFWVEMGVYFLARAMKSGSWHDVLLAGIAQGLAYLSKSHLAAIVTGLALTAWLLPLVRLGRPEDSRIRFRHVIMLFAAAAFTAAPWTIYCVVHYPREFLSEQRYVLLHMTSAVETWGGPWDRVLFDHMILLYNALYTPVLAAALGLLGKAWSERSTSLWLIYAWALGVVVPLLAARTKTPSATLIAVPAFLLLLARLISLAWAGSRWPLAVWTGIALVCLSFPGRIRPCGYGYPDPPVFAGVMRQSLWVVYHVAAAFGIAVALRGWLAGAGVFDRPRAARLAAVVGTAALCVQCAGASLRATTINRARPDFEAMAAFIHDRLPRQAVFLFDGPDAGDHHALMMAADRACYSLRGRTESALGRHVLERGGVPFIVSASARSLPPLYKRDGERRAIYAWTEE